MSKSKKEIVSATGLQELEDAENAASKKVRKAFSVDRIKGGWVMLEYSIRDGQIVGIKSSEPNLKSFAINDFKKAAFHYWDKEVEL